jgi:hypothetical protein
LLGRRNPLIGVKMLGCRKIYDADGKEAGEIQILELETVGGQSPTFVLPFRLPFSVATPDPVKIVQGSSLEALTTALEYLGREAMDGNLRQFDCSLFHYGTELAFTFSHSFDYRNASLLKHIGKFIPSQSGPTFEKSGALGAEKIILKICNPVPLNSFKSHDLFIAKIFLSLGETEIEELVVGFDYIDGLNSAVRKMARVLFNHVEKLDVTLLKESNRLFGIPLF